MVRGTERRRIFRSDRDRSRCLERLGAAIAAGGAALYAWCLMPNHVHALIRSGATPLGRLAQRWAGAYACDFNRRHRRAGHLFQNRFKSILVEEERYLLELLSRDLGDVGYSARTAPVVVRAALGVRWGLLGWVPAGARPSFFA